jgi:hypothetical protein
MTGSISTVRTRFSHASQYSVKCVFARNRDGEALVGPYFRERWLLHAKHSRRKPPGHVPHPTYYDISPQLLSDAPGDYGHVSYSALRLHSAKYFPIKLLRSGVLGAGLVQTTPNNAGKAHVRAKQKRARCQCAATSPVTRRLGRACAVFLLLLATVGWVTATAARTHILV